MTSRGSLWGAVACAWMAWGALPAEAAEITWRTAVSGNWTDGTKWEGGVVPGASDVAVIAVTGASYTVTINSDLDLLGMRVASANATVVAAGRTITTGGVVEVTAGTLQLEGSTVRGTGSLQVASRLNIYGMTTLGVPLTNAGLTWVQGEYTLGNANLVAEGGLTNQAGGTVTLTSSNSSRWAMVSGSTFTNLGTLTAARWGGGNRYIRALLTNQGTVDIDQDTTLDRSGGGTHVNRGTLNVNDTLRVMGNGQTFRQEDGTTTLAVNLYVESAGYEFTGGAHAGAGRVHLHASHLQDTATGAGSFLLRNACTFTGNVASGQTLTLEGEYNADSATLTSSVGFTNAGTIRLTSAHSSRYAQLVVSSGDLLNLGTLSFDVGSGGARYLNADLVNDGTVQVNQSLTLNRTNGVYRNRMTFNTAAGQTVSMSGADKRFQQVAGTLSNAGAFHVLSARVDFAGGTLSGNAVYVENGTLDLSATGAGSFLVRGNTTLLGNVAAPQTVTLQGEYNVGNANLTSAGPLTNRGTLRLTSLHNARHAQLVVTSGDFSNLGTVWVDVGSGGTRYLNANLLNDGTVNVNESLVLNKGSGHYRNRMAFNIASGQTVTLDGAGKLLEQLGGVLSNAGALNVLNARLNFKGGNITGNAVLVQNSTLEVTSDGEGRFTARGTVPFWGNLAAGQALTIQGDYNVGDAVMVAQETWQNAGSVTLTSTHSTRSSVLRTLAPGVLTNLGTVAVLPGSGGGRYLRGHVVNQGSVNVDHELSVDQADALVVNEATWVVKPGDTMYLNGARGTFEQRGGELDVDGAFWLYENRFHFTGGAVLGQVSLRRSALDIAAEGEGTFLARGACTLSGDVSAAQTITVDGEYNLGNASLTSARGFTNHGTIRLTSSHLNNWAMLSSPETLNNHGLIQTLAGSGNNRYLRAPITNRGTIRNNCDTYLDRTGAAFVNEGSVEINGAWLWVAGGSQTFRQASGTMTGAANLHMWDVTADFDGGTSTGWASCDRCSLGFQEGAVVSLYARGAGTLRTDLFTGQSVLVGGEYSVGSASLTRAGPLSNAGTIRLYSWHSDRHATLTTGGALFTNTGTLTSEPGSGGARNASVTLLNLGTVTISTDTTLGVTGASHVNRGLIIANNVLNVTGASLENQEGGTLAGNSTINVGTLTVPSAGAISPGGAPGNLVLTGGVTMAPTSVLDVQLGGTTVVTQYDRFQSQRAVALHGTLKLSLINGFTPAVGQTFTVMTCSSCTGAFLEVEAPELTDVGSFDVQYNAASVVVRILKLPSFRLTPSTTSPVAGVPLDFTVEALDADDNLNTAYVGTALFSSSDPQALVPDPTPFTAEDLGVKTFPGGVTLKTVGPQVVRVISGENTLVRGTRTLSVTPSTATADQTTITATPTSVEANAATTSLVTVTPRDAFGNRVGTGHTVALVTTAGTLEDSVLDAGNGTYTQVLRSPLTPATATVSANVDGVPVTATATVEFRPDTTPPGRVTLTGTAQGSSVAQLSWTASSSADLDHYQLTRFESGLPLTAEVLGTALSWDVTGLLACTSYGFEVDAVDHAGNVSLPSNHVALQTHLDGDPDAPATLAASPHDLYVALSWPPATACDAASYEVHRAETPGGPYAAVATGITATSHLDLFLQNGVTYHYVVITVDSEGRRSVASVEASATPVTEPPGAPVTNLSASTQPAGRVRVAWAPPETGTPVTYRVHRASAPITDLAAATVVATTASLTTDDLPPADGTYHYTVTWLDLVNRESLFPPSVAALSDRGPPTATVDVEGRTALGVGTYVVTLALSEQLPAAPSLSFTPPGAAALPLDLTADPGNPRVFTASLTVQDGAPPGTGRFTWSGTDAAGNTGTTLTSGATITADGVAPWARITTSPVSPVRAGLVSVTLVGSESLRASPTLTFTPHGGAAMPLSTVGVGTTWSAVLEVTPSTGDGEGTFTVEMSDVAGNASTSLTSGDSLVIDTVPPGVPTGVTVDPGLRGALVVRWATPAGEPVATYCLYRDVVAITDVSALVPTACGLVTTTAEDLPPADGTYHYAVTALDLAGNASAPSPSAEGVSDQTPPLAPLNLVAVVNVGDVVLSWEPPPGEPAASYVVYRDTTAFDGDVGARTPLVTGITLPTYQDTPPREALYHYVVVAVDAVSLVSAPSNEVTATVDTEAPRIEVSGVVDGVHRDGAVTPVISITDVSTVTSTVTLDGVPFTSGTTVTADGSYVLVVTARDEPGHESTATIGFVIDTVPPTVSWDVTESQHFEITPAPRVTAEDDHLASVTSTLNGRPYESGTPVTTDGAYTLHATATDKAGNTAEATVHFTVDLPPQPVASAHLALTDTLVTLRWVAAVEPDVTGYRVRRNGELVFQGPGLETDAGAPPSRDQPVTIHVVAVDSAGHQGGPLVLEVPAVRVALAGYGTSREDGSQALTHGLFDEVRFQLVNDGTVGLDLGPLAFEVRDYEDNVRWDEPGTGIVPVPALGTANVVEVLATSAELVGPSNHINVELALPPTAQLTGAYRTTFLVTGRFPPGAPLEAVHGTLVRGTQGEVSLRVSNMGSADLQLVSRQGGGSSDQMRVRLRKPDLTVLVDQGVDDAFSGAPLGSNRVTTVQPGKSHTFVPTRFTIPADAPDNVVLEVAAQPVHHGMGTPKHLTGEGFTTTKVVRVVPPPYLVTAVTDKPAYAMGETVMISGVATQTADGQPATQASVKLTVSWRGFKRTHYVRTNDLGAYLFPFVPAPSDAGLFDVGAVHPSVVVHEVDTSFTINGFEMTPGVFNLQLVKNSSWTAPFTLRNTGETPLTGLTFSLEDVAPDDGVTATTDVVVPSTLAAGAQVRLPVRFSAALVAANSATFRLHASTSETGERISTVNVRLWAAEPILRTDPHYVQVALTAGSSELRSVSIHNEGYDTWRNVRVEGPATMNWVTLPTGRGPFDLEVGQRLSFDTLFMPPDTTASGQYSGEILFKSDNAADVRFPVSARVTTSLVGHAEVKVTNLVYALTEPGKPVVDAVVTLQSLDLYTISEVQRTGADGVARFQDLPAGRYQYWVRASGFKGPDVDGAVPDHGEFLVVADRTATLEVGLMETFVEVSWSVTPTTIQDQYDVTVETTFETKVPVPVVQVVPARMTFDLAPGTTATGQIELFNLGMVSAWNLDLSLAQDHYLDVQFATTRIVELPARSSMVIPYTVYLRTHGSPAPTPCTSYSAQGGYDWQWYCTTGGYWERRRTLGFDIQVRSHVARVSLSPNPVMRATFYNCPGFENGTSEVPPDFTVTSGEGTPVRLCDCGRMTSSGIGLPTLSSLVDQFMEEVTGKAQDYVSGVLSRVGVPSWDDVASGAADAAGQQAFGDRWGDVKAAKDQLDNLRDQVAQASGYLGQAMDMWNDSTCEDQDLADNIGSFLKTVADEATDQAMNWALQRVTGGILGFNKAYSKFDTTCLGPGQSSRADVPEQGSSFGLGTMGLSVAMGCGDEQTGACCPVTATYVDYTVICTDLSISSSQTAGGGSGSGGGGSGGGGGWGWGSSGGGGGGSVPTRRAECTP